MVPHSEVTSMQMKQFDAQALISCPSSHRNDITQCLRISGLHHSLMLRWPRRSDLHDSLSTQQPPYSRYRLPPRLPLAPQQDVSTTVAWQHPSFRHSIFNNIHGLSLADLRLYMHIHSVRGLRSGSVHELERLLGSNHRFPPHHCHYQLIPHYALPQI
jgi:hypothetical protein